jgi:hypothetical protein
VIFTSFILDEQLEIGLDRFTSLLQPHPKLYQEYSQIMGYPPAQASTPGQTGDQPLLCGLAQQVLAMGFGQFCRVVRVVSHAVLLSLFQ